MIAELPALERVRLRSQKRFSRIQWTLVGLSTRAHEIYAARVAAGKFGTAKSDWMEAETEMRREQEECATRRAPARPGVRRSRILTSATEKELMGEGSEVRRQ